MSCKVINQTSDTGPGRGAVQPKHQPLLWGFLLHVHGISLRHPGPGPGGLQRRPVL